MRWLALSMMMVLGFAAGCEKPMEETYPAPSIGSSSGTTDAVAETTEATTEATEGTEAPPAAGETPAVEGTVTETPAEEKPSAETPAAETPAAEVPAGTEATPAKEGSAANAKISSTKFVAATINVPTMSCPHGCWPTVKETLVKQAGVESVELAKQANEAAINNPQVYVKLNGKFDANAAIAALAEAGFADAKVVN